MKLKIINSILIVSLGSSVTACSGLYRTTHVFSTMHSGVLGTTLLYDLQHDAARLRVIIRGDSDPLFHVLLFLWLRLLPTAASSGWLVCIRGSSGLGNKVIQMVIVCIALGGWGRRRCGTFSLSGLTCKEHQNQLSSMNEHE